MKHTNASRPEHELFLLEAARAMRDYHDRGGVYPERWHLLPMTFAVGLYHIGDPDVRPPVGAINRWKPRGCDLTYVIAEATDQGYRIVAVDAEDRPRHILREVGAIESMSGGGHSISSAVPSGDRSRDDPEEVALHMVWEASHGVYLDDHPGCSVDSLAKELYATSHQLDYYEELRARGYLDRELELRRAARLAGRLHNDVWGRHPGLQDHD